MTPARLSELTAIVSSVQASLIDAGQPATAAFVGQLLEALTDAEQSAREWFETAQKLKRTPLASMRRGELPLVWAGSLPGGGLEGP